MKIQIKDIRVETSDPTTRRIRKQHGDIVALAESIKKHGLIHPVVVDKIGDTYRLIAGERRLRACILINLTEIEANLLSLINDVEAKEIELEENVVRKSLEWIEECNALDQLNELKRLQHGKAQPGSTEGWKIADTAEAVGMGTAAVAQDIKLARDLTNNPHLINKVRRLPKTAARKIVRQELEADMLRRRVERNELTISSDLLLGDSCNLIDNLKDEIVHMLLTDPPFARKEIVNVGHAGGMTYNITETNVSDEDTMRKTYKILLPKIFKKLIPGAHMYMFLAMGWYCELIGMLREIGFVVDDLPLIWHKRRPSCLAKDMHYTSSYEAVLFGHKPPITRILKKPVMNVFPISPPPERDKAHPLQRPFELLKIFIENSSNVGELILDPFAGSASTLVAAKKLGRSAVGYEIDEANYLRAQEFMSKELK